MEYAKSMSKSEFVEYITGDQLAGLPSISSRAMFGGFGIYREGTIVGIVISEELYLKVDATNQVEYEAMGSIPFEYEKKDCKRVSMSYWKVPCEIIEDREKLTQLVEDAYKINIEKSLKKKKYTKK